MTWREMWAAQLSVESRVNLRSWGIDVPEPPVGPSSPAAGPMPKHKAKETLERMYNKPDGAQGCGCPWERGPRNVHTGEHKDGPCRTPALTGSLKFSYDKMYGGTIIVPRS